MSNITIKSVAELSIEQLDKLDNIDGVTILDPLDEGRYNTTVSVDEYKKIYEKLMELTDGIKDEWSAKKKFVLIFNRVSRNIVYDYIAGYPKKGKRKQEEYSKRERINCRNLKNGLLKGKCVCAGYAEILRNACLLKGVPAIEIDGKVPSGERHAWNQVEIDNGIWIEVDPTWSHSCVTNEIGNSKEKCWKNHKRKYADFGNGLHQLLISDDKPVSNFNLTEFLNEEFDLNMDDLTEGEQAKFITLLDERDTKGLDITSKLNRLIKTIKITRQRIGETDYYSRQSRNKILSDSAIDIIHKFRFNIRTGERINWENVLTNPDFHPDVYEIIIKEIARGNINTEEARLILDYKKGMPIDLSKLESKIEDRKTSNKESLKNECGDDVLNVLSEWGCNPFQIKKIAATRFDPKTGEKIDRKKVVDQTIQEKIKEFKNEFGYSKSELLHMGFTCNEIDKIVEIKFDSKTGEKIDRKKILDQAIVEKRKEFESEVGHTIPELYKMGFTKDEVNGMQRKFYFNNKTGERIDIDRRKRVDQAIVEKKGQVHTPVCLDSAIDISEKEVTSHDITAKVKALKRIMEKIKQPKTKHEEIERREESK